MENIREDHSADSEKSAYDRLRKKQSKTRKYYKW